MMFSCVRMAGVNGDRKGKKDDNGIGTAIDFMLSNAKLVLGVGGAAMLGIATLAVKRVRKIVFGSLGQLCQSLQNGEWHAPFAFQMYDRAISAPTSPTKMEQSGKRSWEEPVWMGSSPRVLNSDMKSTVSRSLQSLPTSSHAFEPGVENSDSHSQPHSPSLINNGWAAWCISFWQTACSEESCSSSTVGANTVALDVIVWFWRCCRSVVG